MNLCMVCSYQWLRAIDFIESGGGVALLYASRELDKIKTANFDQKIGVQIIQNALKVLFDEQIVRTSENIVLVIAS